ncbi:hypothetical protein F5Y13DRAFT_92766 [Hypoxylon sp. FL1857]|nr:hypothetical protein F5Y13DRAFT_92766 [Hypoxylon sp. FL1857]
MPTFTDLPPEMRLKIWDLALHKEAQDRLLIIYQAGHYDPPRLLPLKHHASPFLSVNYESRHRAKAFYPVKLAVYELPQISDDEHQNNYRCRQRYFKTARGMGRVKGSLYFSPEWDVFISLLDADIVLSHMWVEERERVLTKQRGPWEVPCYYVTAKLSLEVATKVRTMVCVREYPTVESDRYPSSDSEDEEQHPYDVPIPHAYSPGMVELLWKVYNFRRIQNYQHLLLAEEDMKKFIYNVIKCRGRGSYNFQKWVVYYDHNPNYTWGLYDLNALQRQNRDTQDSLYKLKPYYDSSNWPTLRQLEGFVPPDPVEDPGNETSGEISVSSASD